MFPKLYGAKMPLQVPAALTADNNPAAEPAAH
jgi:hypothetical protein